MEALCDSAQFLYSNGKSLEALKAAARCEELAERVKNDDWLGRAQNLNGIVHADVGNLGEALVHYSKALASARRIGNLPREVSVLNCLGVAYNYAGLYRHALPCLNRSLSLVATAEYSRTASEVGPMASEYGRAALTNKAQSHLFLEEFEEGFSAINQCIKESPEPWDALSSERRVIRESTFVRLALELGKLSTARRHVIDAHHYAARATERARFYCQVTSALCEVHGGDAAIGIKNLENLLTRAGAPAERTTVLSDLVKSYDQIGRPENALARLQALMKCLHRMREEGLTTSLALGLSIQSPEAITGPDPLEYREAVLRAKVSERVVAQERIDMFERLAVAADLKEDDSGRHGYRVGKLSHLIAERLHWPPEKAAALELAARLHDIGKIAMPDRVLFSTGELDPVQREVMSTHTTVGGELLSKGNSSDLRCAEEIARHHHEWWNGMGYPSKLSGKRISIHARIVALADVFDALTHGRPYAPAWPIDKALEEIQSRRGTQFDPDLTDTFLTLIEELRREHADLDAFLGEASRNSPFLQARDRIRLMLEGDRHDVNIAAAAAETVQ